MLKLKYVIYEIYNIEETIIKSQLLEKQSFDSLSEASYKLRVDNNYEDNKNYVILPIYKKIKENENSNIKNGNGIKK